MASSAAVNGVGQDTSQDVSPAQRLHEKHLADAPHQPQLEDAIDEEDLAHPPPSMQLPPQSSPTANDVEPQSLSEKAAGKQKAVDEPVKPKPSAAPPVVLDTKSEDAFPALGGGPKPQAQSPMSMAWGARKPPSVAKAVPNGINGQGPPSSPSTSRASTPASGRLTPATTHASAGSQLRGPSHPQHIPIPGRHSERIQFAPSQLLPRDQLKKPLQDILRGINKRSKANVEMKSGPGGTIIFEGTGPVDAARQALRDVAKEVGSKQSVKIPIPLSVRPHIIGRQGAVVQAITKRTGARIQVPKAEETTTNELEDDDSVTIDVEIEGDAVAAEMARREIESIINERTSTVNMRLKDIPEEYYPFIAGPHNAGISALEKDRQVNVHVPQYHTWSGQPPPQAPVTGMLPQFGPNRGSHIRISGDRIAAQEARLEIERQVEVLRRQITLSQLAINRGQHQFIIGDKGTSMHELLEETGCAVILPPSTDDTETLTITGPQDKIDVAIDKVLSLATTMHMASIDIAKQHASAPAGAQAHARALTRYLQRRQEIEELERQFDARIVLPTNEDSPMNWEVYSRDGKNTIKARSDIMNLINAHPPARLRHVPVDPFYHQHLQRQAAQHLQDEFGVHLLLPEGNSQSRQLVLIYEGLEKPPTSEYRLPRQRPSSREITEFQKALHQAQAHVESLMHGRQQLASHDINVPSKYYEKVLKQVNREQQHLPPNEIPVQILPVIAHSINSSTAIQQPRRGPDSAEHVMTLRGPADMAGDLAQKLMLFLEREKQDELERGHVISFDFPPKFANFLIGRKGENINKYREEFDVEIQINDGKVEIKGPVAKAEMAKAKIIALGKKLEDEATHVLKIKPQYHKELIGAKGAQVNRLQDRYNVRVQFPRTIASLNDENSVADGASEVGASRNARSSQAPDEVIIRGPRKGADEARDELLNLLQWTIDNSHTSTVSVAQSQLPSLIGQGGREMENTRLATGAQIDVPGNRDSANANGRVQVQIRGTKKQVEEAKSLLEQKAKVFDNTVSRAIQVDKKYHKALIGGGGANIRNIALEAGGSDDGRTLAKTVRFPRADSGDSSIHVEGSQAIVDKIVASIESFVKQRESEAAETLDIAPEKHRLLIGRGGETRRALESKFNIKMDIPRLTQEGPARSRVKLVGQRTDLNAAKEHILELVKDQEGATINVPRRLHHAVSDNGLIFRRLRNDHKVTVEHAGHQPPARQSSRSRLGQTNGNALPLITDQQDNIDGHLWETVDHEEGQSEEGDIPWVLHGSAENMAKAQEMLQKALEQAQRQQQSWVGYLTLPDPRTYRFVIGAGGSQINSIRQQTGCKINVPRDQAKGEPIEVVGSKDGIEQAKEKILEAVQNGGNGGRMA
ncbi:MAG: hypothetical protein L6R37_001729 [Teloschistes peruensis]|nr:MAG: hypothetical protein L6R37_001729 [Teloschistes peruensis]